MPSKTYVFVSSFTVLLILVASRVLAQAKADTSGQMEALIKEKQSRTPAQQKVDSRLLHAIREKQGTKTGDGTISVTVTVHTDSNGNIDVEIKADVTDQLLSNIKALGGRIMYTSAKYHTVKAAVNLMAIEKIAGYREVQFIRPAAVPQLERTVKPDGAPGRPGTDPPSGRNPSL